MKHQSSAARSRSSIRKITNDYLIATKHRTGSHFSAQAENNKSIEVQGQKSEAALWTQPRSFVNYVFPTSLASLLMILGAVLPHDVTFCCGLVYDDGYSICSRVPSVLRRLFLLGQPCTASPLSREVGVFPSGCFGL